MSLSTIVSYLSTGHLLSVDKNFEHIFGYSQSELLGTVVQDIIFLTPYREAFTAVLSSYEKYGKPELPGLLYQMKAIHKDGSMFFISQSQCVNGEGSSLIFIANFEKNQVAECTITFDIHGTILLCTSQVLQFFGERKMLGRKILDFIPNLPPLITSDGKLNYLYLMDGVEVGKMKEMNVRVIAHSSIVDMVLQVQAINVGMKEVVFKGTLKYHNISSEVVLLANSSDQIMACSSQVLAMLGYKEEELRGKELNFLLPDLVHTEEGEHLHKKRRTLPLVWRHDGVRKLLELKHHDGSTMMTISTSLPVNQNDLSVILRKVEGTDLSPELQIIGKYSIGELIATGTYGKVKKANHLETGNEVAVKIINKKLMNEQEAKKAMTEIEILRSLDHFNIIRFRDLVDTGERIYLFMEYMKDSQTLKPLIDKGLSETQAKAIFRQLVDALLYCHLMHVIHRDIKPANILVHKDGHIKLIDFGLSAIIESGKLQGTFCGSPSYVAPEIVLSNTYSGLSADIWSLGVLLYAMLTGKLPFENLQQTLACEWEQPQNISEECKNILSRMIVCDPSQRISTKEILTHPWLS